MKMLPVILLLLTCAILPAQAADHPSAMERIAAKREIRCGYYVYSPHLRKDANTGELSGIFYELMREIGKNSGLTIAWVEEAGLSDVFTGLDADRYDVWCSGLWPNGTRGLVGSFTHPAFYSVITPWVRADDDRFINLDDLKRLKAKLTVVDGAMDAVIAQNDFPDLPRISLPQMTPYATNFQNTMTGKADATFAEPSTVAEFLARNPGTLRSLGAGQALRTFGTTLAVRQGDTRTQEFLNVAMDEVVYSGAVDRILKKYEPVKGAFLRLAPPFQLPPE